MIGIIQGRLTVSRKKLQTFPKNPFLEFKTASKIGYDFIEFFSEEIINKRNPIWSKEGIREYIKITKLNKIKTYSFIDEYPISHSLAKLKTLENSLKTLERAQKLNIKKFIIISLNQKMCIMFPNIEKAIIIIWN